MRYMLLIYSNERAETQANPAEMQAIMQGHQAVMEGTMKAGILRAADPLHPTSTAAGRSACRTASPSPPMAPSRKPRNSGAAAIFLDCKDLDEAIHWASQIPTACKGGSGCVEIRPVLEIAELKDQIQQAVAKA